MIRLFSIILFFVASDINVTNIKPKHIYAKFGGNLFSCVLYVYNCDIYAEKENKQKNMRFICTFALVCKSIYEKRREDDNNSYQIQRFFSYSKYI